MEEIILEERNGAGEKVTLNRCPRCSSMSLHRAVARHYISEDCYTPLCYYWTFRTINTKEN